MSEARRTADSVEDETVSSSPAAVRQTLLKARAVLRGGARPNRPFDAGQPPVETMLTEIGETIQVRRLVFVAAGGRRLVVEAGQGRLTKVIDIQPAAARSPESADLLESRRLGREDARAAAQCFEAFASEAGSPTVVAEPLPPAAKASEGGVTPSELRQHLTPSDWRAPEVERTAATVTPVAKPKPASRRKPPAKGYPKVETLPEALRAKLGVALRGVAVTADRGRVDVVAEMERFPIAEILRATAKAPRPSFLDRALPGAKLVVMLGEGGRDPALGYCSDPQDTLSFCVNTEAVPAAVDAWRGHERCQAAKP